MLIHPWDSAPEDEALDFVRANEFGHLVAARRGREVPVVAPTQFLLTGDRTILLHLARPNPIWAAIEENPAVVVSLAGDWSYVPGAWKALPGLEDPSMGVPTTYYAAVQLVCRAEVVGDAEGKAAILRAQLARLEAGGELVDPAVPGRVTRPAIPTWPDEIPARHPPPGSWAPLKSGAPPRGEPPQPVSAPETWATPEMRALPRAGGPP